jgi:RAB protein geranylgeranyltransferase component A
VKAKLLSQARRFNIDLSPNIFYARGQLIELLISSDVGKYCEFRMVSQVLTRRADRRVHKVPVSRAEVFKSTQLGMIEKRVMMQFVQSCVKENNFADLIDPQASSNISFRQLITNKKLPESVAHFLINNVAMCPNEANTAAEVCSVLSEL